MKLIIGNKNYSSWSMRPWLLLKHADIAFEEVRIPLFTSSTPAAIKGFSDAGKVPVLLDGKVRCWDSLAICEYLNERYLDNKGWPQADVQRAQARAISAEMHAGFYVIREQLPLNCRAEGRNVYISTVLQQEIDRIEQIWQTCRRNAVLAGPWLFGEFSIADCMYAPIASRFRTYGVALSGFAADYMRTWCNDEHFGQWVSDAMVETEIIEAAEVGLPDNG